MLLPSSIGPRLMTQELCLETHDSRLETRDSVTHTLMLQDPIKTSCCIFLFHSFYSFPYIMKSKFGNYGTLDALAEQRRVQGGNFNPQVLMDMGVRPRLKIHVDDL